MNNTIRDITETLLFEPFNYKGVYDGVHQLHDLFAAASEVRAGNIIDKDINLPSGNAVSTIKAAHCLLEFQRTAVFLRGIYKAILQLKKDFPNERLHILYAGCGPYATLLTPLTAYFRADELAFYLLDINEASVEAAQKLFTELKLNDYVEEWIIADATKYQIPYGEIRHLIISETMLNALRKEPQVEIMLNLVPQLPANGLFVPQEITVSAKLLSPRLETDRYLTPDHEPERINLGTVYSIGRKNCAKHQPVIITIPKETGVFKQLSLLTDITTFADEKLGIYASSLNMPMDLFNADEHTGKQLRFQYITGEYPGFKYEWVNAEPITVI
jgi:hypothetical protein